MCSNYGRDLNGLFGDHDPIKVGGSWKNIRGIMGSRDDVYVVAVSGMRKEVGNCSSILFWKDVWLGGKKLCDVFPRFYSVSKQKHMMISDMGCWDGYC